MKLVLTKSWFSIACTLAVALAAGEASAAVSLTRVSNTATQTTYKGSATGFTPRGRVTVTPLADTVGISQASFTVTADSAGKITFGNHTARHNPNVCRLRVFFRNDSNGAVQSGQLSIPSPCKKLALARASANGNTASNFTASNIYGGADAHVKAYFEYLDVDEGLIDWAESYPNSSTWRFSKDDYWDYNRLIRMTVVDQLTGATASVTYRPIF